MVEMGSLHTGWTSWEWQFGQGGGNSFFSIMNMMVHKLNGKLFTIDHFYLAKILATRAGAGTHSDTIRSGTRSGRGIQGELGMFRMGRVWIGTIL